MAGGNIYSEDIDPLDPMSDAEMDYGYGPYDYNYSPDDELPSTSSLGTLQSLSQAYLGGVDPQRAFDEVKRGKIAALRAARKAFEVPDDRMNLPALAFGAQMMMPTRSGRFGEAFGTSINAMMPWIESQRQGEDVRRAGLAQLDATEAGLEGEDLYNRMQTGLELLQKASELEGKLIDKSIDRRTRYDIAKMAADARRDAAEIIAGQREESALQSAIRAAQTNARLDAQNLGTMGYSIAPDELAGWIQKRTDQILNAWGYTPERLRGATAGTTSALGVDPAAEAEMQNELSLEALARGDFDEPVPGAEPSPASPGSQPPVDTGSPPMPEPSGGWSRQNKPLNPTEMKLVEEADTNYQNLTIAEDSLNEALSINEKTYGGEFARAHSWVERNLEWLGDWAGLEQSEEAINTTRYNILINEQAAAALKATFGGSGITDSERNFLIDLQASVDKSPKEREPILKRGLKIIKMRKDYNDWKSKRIREGDYRAASYADWLRQQRATDPAAEE